MKTLQKIVVLFLFTSFSVLAQQKITLEEIWGGAFRTQGMTELAALKNTNQYTVLNSDGTSNAIDLYDFATLNKVSTLINSNDFSDLNGIDSYTFSKDEKKVLIANNTDEIFRHSFLANFYIYDIATKSLTKISDDKIQEPTFSPDGSKIAFAKENNLYIYELASNRKLSQKQILLHKPNP